MNAALSILNSGSCGRILILWLTPIFRFDFPIKKGLYITLEIDRFGDEVLAAARRKHILDMVNSDGGVRTTALPAMLNTSLPTIRRDLEILHRQGLLIRTHGGAVSHSRSTTFEPPYRQKVHLQAEEKDRIGKAAAALIAEGDSVIFDSGSTCLQIARHAHGKPFTAIALDLPVAVELADDPKIDLLVVGGKVRTGLYSFVGPLTEELLTQFHVNRFFLAVDGVHLSHGITNATAAEVPVKRAAIRAAQEVILVTDSSKFQRQALMRVCSLEAVHQVITTRAVPAEVPRALRRRSVRVLLV
jgi:DeoR/GlpR family transcriptional regulator of sugar metabolism